MTSPIHAASTRFAAVLTLCMSRNWAATSRTTRRQSTIFSQNPADLIALPQGFSTAGEVQAMTGTSGDPSFLLSPKMLGLYIEDDFRVTPRLLLNVGIRYDRDINTYGIDKQKISRTHQELVAAAATGIPTVPTTVNPNTYLTGYTPNLTNIGGVFTGLPDNDNLDISPRLGFTFDVLGNGRFVVHGGYGLYFGQSFENIPLFMIQQANNTVFANTFSISCNGPNDPKCGADQTVPGHEPHADELPVWHRSTSGDSASKPRSRAQDQLAASWIRAIATHIRSRSTPVSSTLRTTSRSLKWTTYRPAVCMTTRRSTSIQFNTLELEWERGPSLPRSTLLACPNLVASRMSSPSAVRIMTGSTSAIASRCGGTSPGTVNYTFAKALAFEGGAASFRNTATNPFLGQFRRQDFGPTPSDERHHVTASATWNLPWKITISPIFQIGTGRPVDIEQASSNLWGYGSGNGLPHAIVPVGASQTNPASYVAFAATLEERTTSTCLEAHTCTEVSYDNYRGPAFVELDARFGKTITIADRYNVNLFFQGFDLTNRANFGSNSRTWSRITDSDRRREHLPAAERISSRQAAPSFPSRSLASLERGSASRSVRV